MFKTSAKAVSCAAIFYFASASAALAADPVAVVNGVSIPQVRMEMRVKAAVAQGQTDNEQLRSAVREELINLEVMAQEAERSGLAKGYEAQQEVEMARQSALVNMFLREYARKNPITDTQLKKEYESQKAKLGKREYSVRHILLASEDEANAVINLLDNKESFEKLAGKSKDAASAVRGGALGWSVPSAFVPSFANALLNLQKGEYTKKPVQTQFGWHVIRLDDERELKLPTFDEVKPQLQKRLQQQALQKAIGELRGKAKIGP